MGISGAAEDGAVDASKADSSNTVDRPGWSGLSPHVRRLVAQVVAVTVVVSATGLRVYHLLLVPLAGDAIRHLRYSEAVLRFGPRALGYTLAQLDRHWGQTTAWANTPYIYPPGAFFLFLPIAAVCPTLLAVKLALTLIEAVNAVLCWRITGRAWIGILYWAYPVSIWHVSREGQYEPVQNLLALLALYFLPTRLPLAVGLLVLAVQTKLTSAALAPLFIAEMWRRRAVLKPAIAALIASVPTLVGLYYYSFLANLGRNPLHINSYHWNPWGPYAQPAHVWEIVPHQAVTWFVLVLLLVGAARSTYKVAYVAPILFVLFLKSSTLAMGWYMLLWPVLVLPIRDAPIRAACLLLWPLTDMNSLIYGPTFLTPPLVDPQAARGIFSVFQKV